MSSLLDVLGRLGITRFPWNGLVWSHTIFLSPRPSGRAATKGHSHFNFLDYPGEPIAFSGIRTHGTLGFTEVGIFQIHILCLLN
jgi:hypothetical protein